MPKSENEPMQPGASGSLPSAYKSAPGSKCHPDTVTVPLAGLKAAFGKHGGFPENSAGRLHS